MLKLVSIESLEIANSQGVQQSITIVFQRHEILDISKHIVGLYLDGASVNMCIHWCRCFA